MPTQGEGFQLGSGTSSNGINSSKMHQHIIPYMKNTVRKTPFHFHAKRPSSFSSTDCQCVQTSAHLCTLPINFLCEKCCWRQKSPHNQTNLRCSSVVVSSFIFLEKWNFGLAERGLALLLTDVASLYSLLNHLRLINVERPHCRQTFSVTQNKGTVKEKMKNHLWPGAQISFYTFLYRCKISLPSSPLLCLSSSPYPLLPSLTFHVDVSLINPGALKFILDLGDSTLTARRVHSVQARFIINFFSPAGIPWRPVSDWLVFVDLHWLVMLCYGLQSVVEL